MYKIVKGSQKFQVTKEIEEETVVQQHLRRRKYQYQVKENKLSKITNIYLQIGGGKKPPKLSDQYLQVGGKYIKCSKREKEGAFFSATSSQVAVLRISKVISSIIGSRKGVFLSKETLLVKT